MSTKNKIEKIKEEIAKNERDIFDLEIELGKQKSHLKLNKAKLEILIDDLRDEFKVGDKLLFKGEHNQDVVIQIITGSEERYDGLLLTDYSQEIECMKKYYKLDYRSDFISTMIDSIEVRFKLKFVERVQEEL